MTRIVYVHHKYFWESDIEIYFEFDNSIVFTTEDIIVNDNETKKSRIINIVTKCELNTSLDSIEALKYVRPKELIIQGIISFLSKYPITIYNVYETQYCPKLVEYEEKNITFIFRSVDHTSDLRTLLNKLKEKPNIVASLLDKWRKALFLISDEDFGDLLLSESVLLFFNAIDLLVSEFDKELKCRLRDYIDDMLNKYFQFCYITDDRARNIVKRNKTFVEKILFSSSFTLGLKIKFFLEKYGLLNDDIARFIDEIVNIRNYNAHGKIIDDTEIDWPLPPFFDLPNDAKDKIDFLPILTGMMISKYIGINLWDKEFTEMNIGARFYADT